MPVTALNAGVERGRLLRAAERAVAGLLARPASALAAAAALSPAAAAAVLDAGVRRLGKMRAVCPVALRRAGGLVSPASLCDPAAAHPAVYGPHVYLCKTAADRAAFLADPVEYTFRSPPAPAPAPHRVVVVGPPRSGKTALSEALAAALGVPVISPGPAVEELVREEAAVGPAAAAAAAPALARGEMATEEGVAELVGLVARRTPGCVMRPRSIGALRAVRCGGKSRRRGWTRPRVCVRECTCAPVLLRRQRRSGATRWPREPERAAAGPRAAPRGIGDGRRDRHVAALPSPPPQPTSPARPTRQARHLTADGPSPPARLLGRLRAPEPVPPSPSAADPLGSCGR